jgi:hypothetical protein
MIHDTMKLKRQIGDPAKLGVVMIPLSEAEKPPVRFAAGTDAVATDVQTSEESNLK